MLSRRYDKAANLLIAARQFDDALTICENERVTITEKMAEDMTLEKTEAGRVELLERIANCCFEQGSYQLATKKYTQAGKKFEAMKSLLKSGDVEKIIFFASRCRQREVCRKDVPSCPCLLRVSCSSMSADLHYGCQSPSATSVAT